MDQSSRIPPGSACQACRRLKVCGMQALPHFPATERFDQVRLTEVRCDASESRRMPRVLGARRLDENVLRRLQPELLHRSAGIRSDHLQEFMSRPRNKRPLKPHPAQWAQASHPAHCYPPFIQHHPRTSLATIITVHMRHILSKAEVGWEIWQIRPLLKAEVPTSCRWKIRCS